MSEISSGRATDGERAAHLIGISGHLNMSTMALWGASERAQRMLGMVEASLRWDPPDERDRETIERLRALFDEAREFHAKEEFPAMMARLRVAYDLVSLRIIQLSGAE